MKQSYKQAVKLVIQRLKAGDAVVVQGKTWLSRQIAQLTYDGTGMWSHVGVVIGFHPDLAIIEATREGVVTTPFSEYFKTEKAFLIARPKGFIDEHFLFKVASTYIGRPYAFAQLGLDFWAAIGAKIFGKGIYGKLDRDPKGVTCAELAGKIYEDYGIEVLSSASAYLAPNDFVDSLQFDTIEVYR